MLFGRRNKPDWREKVKAALWPKRGITRPFVYLAQASATPLGHAPCDRCRLRCRGGLFFHTAAGLPLRY